MGQHATALGALEGWRSEGYAARVHYEGATERYSVEFYEPTELVIYWAVRDDDEAVPVSREDVPGPLRQRVREDLSEAGVDPAVESRSL